MSTGRSLEEARRPSPQGGGPVRKLRGTRTQVLRRGAASPSGRTAPAGEGAARKCGGDLEGTLRPHKAGSADP